VTGCFEILNSGPVIVDKTHDLVSKLWAFRDLPSKLDGSFIRTHNQQEPNVLSAASQRQKQ
jgi:hypothetical protein